MESIFEEINFSLFQNRRLPSQGNLTFYGTSITLTRPCNEHPTSYKEKLGLKGYILFFLILAQKHSL